MIAAWFDHVADDPQLPGRHAAALLSDGRRVGARARRGHGAPRRRGAYFARHQRALLAPAGDRSDLSRRRASDDKKRKELRRQRKRLGDSGSVTSSDTGEPSAVPRALDDFLALEADGWKGRAGTAARGDADIAGFMTAAVTALAGEGKARIARLCARRTRRSPPW